MLLQLKHMLKLIKQKNINSRLSECEITLHFGDITDSIFVQKLINGIKNLTQVYNFAA